MVDVLTLWLFVGVILGFVGGRLSVRKLERGFLFVCLGVLVWLFLLRQMLSQYLY